MPDIAMCSGEGCPRRTECYRHTAKVTEPRGQSYFLKPPGNEAGCDYFMPVWVRPDAPPSVK
jgi:hypothetical protein